MIKPDSVTIMDRNTKEVLKTHELMTIKSWGVSCMYFVMNLVVDGVMDKEYFYTLQGTQIDFLMTSYAYLAVNEVIPKTYKRKFTPTSD